MDKRVDLIIGLVVAVCGVAVLILAAGFRPGTVTDPIGTAGLPRALGVLMLIGGAAVVVRRLLGWRTDNGVLVQDEGKADDPQHPASSARALGIAAGTVVYALALQPVGFPLATPLFLTGVMMAMGTRRPLQIFAVAVGVTIFVHLLFVGLFGILLPLGPLVPFNRVLWFRF